MEHNLVGWFEIPVADMDRAKKFYESVFEIEISVHDLDGFVMVKHEMYTPSLTDGVLIYFSCKDVNNELKRVDVLGGSILKPKTEIGGGHGFMALIIDSEGNRIALHSQQ